MGSKPNERVPRWAIDSMKVQAAFTKGFKGGLLENQPPEPWSEESADAMEDFANALMQGLTQKTGGQEGYQASNDAGELVSFDDVWTITERLALMAVELVLCGGHRAAIGSARATVEGE